METPVVTVTDAGIIQNDDEIEIENTESTPSAARQEVNKPCDEANNGETDSENDNLNARTEQPGASPKKALKRNVSFPPESPVTGCLDPPDPWKNGIFIFTGVIGGCFNCHNLTPSPGQMA